MNNSKAREKIDSGKLPTLIHSVLSEIKTFKLQGIECQHRKILQMKCTGWCYDVGNTNRKTDQISNKSTQWSKLFAMLTGPRSANALAQKEIFFNLWFNRLEVERFMYFYSFDLIYRSHHVIMLLAKLHFSQKLTLMNIAINIKRILVIFHSLNITITYIVLTKMNKGSLKINLNCSLLFPSFIF